MTAQTGDRQARQADQDLAADGREPMRWGADWFADQEVLADANAQTRPYTGDQSASDKAWSARVNSAVQGMDVLDRDGLDAWMDSHAKSAQPHLAEAALVAVWETRIRDLFALDTTGDDSVGDSGGDRDQDDDDQDDDLAGDDDTWVWDDGDDLP